MSMRDYPLYYQGALLNPDCFDASRLLHFLLEEYEEVISPAASTALENGELTDELKTVFCDNFCLDESDFDSLDELKEEILTGSMEVYETLEPLLSQGEGITFHHLTGITANFDYIGDYESETLEEANLLAFEIPKAWDTRNEKHPSCLEEALAWLDRAGQRVFQTDIDWEPRLGELLGTVYG